MLNVATECLKLAHSQTVTVWKQREWALKRHYETENHRLQNEVNSLRSHMSERDRVIKRMEADLQHHKSENKRLKMSQSRTGDGGDTSSYVPARQPSPLRGGPNVDLLMLQNRPYTTSGTTPPPSPMLQPGGALARIKQNAVDQHISPRLDTAPDPAAPSHFHQRRAGTAGASRHPFETSRGTTPLFASKTISSS